MFIVRATDMLFYSLIVGAVVLFVFKVNHDIKKVKKINMIIQDYYELKEKLLEMDMDPLETERDFKNILSICKSVDRQVEEILKIPAYRKQLDEHEFQKLADIVRQRMNE